VRPATECAVARDRAEWSAGRRGAGARRGRHRRGSRRRGTEDHRRAPGARDIRRERQREAIYFDFDRYDIRPEDARTLEADAAWLKSNKVLILAEGQCDERCTDATWRLVIDAPGRR